APAPAPAPAPALSPPIVDGSLPWHEVVPMLGLDPMTLQLANNTTLAQLGDKECELLLMGGHVSLNKKSEKNLQQALSDYYGRTLQLILTSGKADLLTPNSIASRKVEVRQQQAVSDAMSNELVKKIITEFDARIIEGSIKPID
ncbi:MAG: DNA polymerase III, subunit gamma and tau, partial [Cycloclasticus sp.]|nr:DNA polymerase III, subunit gamma and tau [Cycloclasticus sp.]